MSTPLRRIQILLKSTKVSPLVAGCVRPEGNLGAHYRLDEFSFFCARIFTFGATCLFALFGTFPGQLTM